MHLQIDPAISCVGCSLCMYWCSLNHLAGSSVSHSRIRIAWNHSQQLPTPQVCQQCSSPACVAACPQNALGKEKEKGYIEVDVDACSGCSTCEPACPFGAVHMDGCSPSICDLCGGDPLCAKVCPVHLIEVVQ